MDSEGNLWVTDVRGIDVIGHQAIKFSPEGEVLMMLDRAGDGGSGVGQLHSPKDVIVDSDDGDIFATESHRN